MPSIVHWTPTGRFPADFGAVATGETCNDRATTSRSRIHPALKRRTCAGTCKHAQACQLNWWQGTRSYKKVPTTSWKTITSKRGKKNFYKGRGVPNAGVSSSRGSFTVLPSKSPHYIIPDVRGSPLGPYVDMRVRPPHKIPKAVKLARKGQLK